MNQHLAITTHKHLQYGGVDTGRRRFDAFYMSHLGDVQKLQVHSTNFEHDSPPNQQFEIGIEIEASPTSAHD